MVRLTSKVNLQTEKLKRNLVSCYQIISLEYLSLNLHQIYTILQVSYR